MEDKDYKSFMTLMGIMAEAFSLKVSENKVEIYFKFLKDLSLEDIKVNVDNLIKTRVYTSFPSVAEIRGETSSGAGEDAAQGAFLTLWNAIKNSIGYQSAEFDDPIVHSVVECLGGLPFICENWFLEDFQWRQREFVQLYKQFSKQKKHPGYLPGIHEIGNLATGYPVKQPKIIRSQRAIEKEEKEVEKIDELIKITNEEEKGKLSIEDKKERKKNNGRSHST